MEDEAVCAGASVHVWLSFGEYVHWSRDRSSTRFVFNEGIVQEFCNRMRELVSASCVPVFVNLCTSSNFFHGSEMHMEQVVGNMLATGLAKLGVAVTCNPLMWSECSNFIDHNMNVIRPTPVDKSTAEVDDWDANAAFACLDKFQFREKMLYACIVGDETIGQLEEKLGSNLTNTIEMGCNHLVKPIVLAVYTA